MDRAKKALHYGVALSFAIGVVMFYISFYHGIVLAGIFSSDPVVVTAGADYLKAYAIDCLLTAIFFCYVGFYNGIGLTKFVMVQGIVGAFFVRVPVSFIMSRQAGGIAIQDRTCDSDVFSGADDPLSPLHGLHTEKRKIKSLGVTSVAPFFFYKTVTTFHSGFMLKWN